MNNVPLSLAWRYLRHRKKDSNVSLMISVCFTGITIGTFALMLTLIVMNGFEKVISEKMQGINPTLSVAHPSSHINPDRLRDALKKQIPHIQASAASSSGQIIFAHRNTHYPTAVRGVEAQRFGSVTTLLQKIISPQKISIEKCMQGKRIIIGHKLARDLGVSVGDTLEAYIPRATAKKKIHLDSVMLTIGGIFDIGLDEYDREIVFFSLKLFNELFEQEGAEQLHLAVNTTHLEEVRKGIKDHFQPLSVYSWQELYPALVSSLRLEKYVSFIVIALIVLVASLNMISLLVVQIQQKQKNIALFSVMGMSSRSIRGIFLAIGMTITLAASLTGLLIAAIVGFALQRYPLINLPDVYYVTTLPIRMQPELFGIVFVCTLLLGLLATLLGMRNIARINISETLRTE